MGQLRVSSLRNRMKKERRRIDKIWDLWHTIKHTSIRVIGSQKERRKSGIKNIWRNDVQKLPKFMKCVNLHIQETQWILSRVTQRNPHVDTSQTVRSQRQRIFKAAGEICHVQGMSIRLTADFSSENWEARCQWSGIFKMLTEKDCQPNILYSVRTILQKWRRN